MIPLGMVGVVVRLVIGSLMVSGMVFPGHIQVRLDAGRDPGFVFGHHLGRDLQLVVVQSRHNTRGGSLGFQRNPRGRRQIDRHQFSGRRFNFDGRSGQRAAFKNASKNLMGMIAVIARIGMVMGKRDARNQYQAAGDRHAGQLCGEVCQFRHLLSLIFVTRENNSV